MSVRIAIDEISVALCVRSHRYSLSRTVTMFQYKFGLTKDKILEYLAILQDLRQFNIDLERDRIQRLAEAQES